MERERLKLECLEIAQRNLPQPSSSEELIEYADRLYTYLTSLDGE